MMKLLRHTFCLLLLLTFAACEKDEGPGYDPPALATHTRLNLRPAIFH